jgi:hypothetical protein
LLRGAVRDVMRGLLLCGFGTGAGSAAIATVLFGI